MLAADVELNPGPITDKEEILQLLKDCHDDLMKEMKGIRAEISYIKTDVEVVKHDSAEVKTKIKCIEDNHGVLQKKSY